MNDSASGWTKPYKEPRELTGSFVPAYNGSDNLVTRWCDNCDGFTTQTKTITDSWRCIECGRLSGD
jgi:hypothetical protein